MEAKQVLERALIQLEFELDEAAEASLRLAIELAEESEDLKTLISAQCCLADFLYSLGQDEEVLTLVNAVLAVDDAPLRAELADEFEMAREFLYELENT